jgi:hypothetical protein
MKHAVGLLVVCALTSTASAQSLADAAARAEEQRQRNSQASRVLTNDSLGGEWALTSAGLEQYANARAAIASIRNRHAEVHQRLWNASMTAATLQDLAPALASEPLVVEALQSNGLTPRDYLRREQALVNAEAWAHRPAPPDIDQNSTRWANMLYLRNAARLIDTLEHKYRDIERSPWWESWRFVQD